MDQTPGQPAPVAPVTPPSPPTPPAYGAPSPYAVPETYTPPPAPVTSPKSSPSRFILPVVGALVIAVVGFAAGFAVANATSSQNTTTALGPNGAGFPQGGFGPGGNGPNASGRPRGGFGGNTTGTVGSVSADQMTVTTPNGSARVVLLTPTTKVTEITSSTKAVTDISSGVTVTVVGTANPDGSVTATNVVIGDIGAFGRGQRPGDNGSPAPSTAP